jgi:hypothetical protein
VSAARERFYLRFCASEPHVWHADSVGSCRVLHRARCVLRAQDEWTPLHYAAQHGYVSIVTLLCERGADKEAKDKVRRAPVPAPLRKQPLCFGTVIGAHCACSWSTRASSICAESVSHFALMLLTPPAGLRARIILFPCCRGAFLPHAWSERRTAVMASPAAQRGKMPMDVAMDDVTRAALRKRRRAFANNGDDGNPDERRGSEDFPF